METSAELGSIESREETDEVSSTADPPGDNTNDDLNSDVTPGGMVLDAEEFKRRVDSLCAMMQDDPTVRDRLLAETYVNIASIEMGVRGAVAMMQEQGAAGMLKGMMFNRRNK